MKKVIKISLISFFLLFTLSVNFCLAQACNPKEDICYTPEITFPGFSGEKKVTPALLGEYISSLYQYLLYVAGVVAVIVIMIAGFQWITAGGNQSKIGEAKEKLTSAIIGLFLALTSYLLLYTINPNLVEIVDLSMPSVIPISNYCTEGQIVTVSSPIDADKANDMGISSELVSHAGGVDGSKAYCGFNYDYQIEGSNYQCKGIYCPVGSQVCYEEMCYSPFDACVKAGWKEYESQDFSTWTGKVKNGWDGEIELYLPENISGSCHKWVLYTAGIDLSMNWNPEEVYHWGWAYDEAVSATVDQIANGISNCSDMRLNFAVEYLACKRSPECGFSRANLISPNKCVDSN